jgi:hypothetical protein
MLLVLALLIAVWWLMRKRRESAGENAATTIRRPAANAEFHAVSIKFSGRTCAAAREMTGRRFLATAAPKLPLNDCDVLECKCQFLHHKDRRANKDRRSPFGPSGLGGGTGAYDSEQRDGTDRRGKDD